MNKVGFGGGCHWCTEAVFQSLNGVLHVRQGFIKSTAPHDQYSEAVLIEYDPQTIDINSLVDIHLRTHASMSAHKMRGKYRSAIYFYSDDQANYHSMLAARRCEFEKPLVTQILPLVAFKLSDERFRNYYQNGPDKPFCKTYIDPKLTMLRKQYSKNYREF